MDKRTVRYGTGGYNPKSSEKPITIGHQPDTKGDRPEWIIPPKPPKKR